MPLSSFPLSGGAGSPVDAAAHLEPQPRIKSSMTLRGAHALYEVQIGIA